MAGTDSTANLQALSWLGGEGVASSQGWANMNRNSSNTSQGIEGLFARNDLGSLPLASAMSSSRCSIESRTAESAGSKNASRFYFTCVAITRA